MMTHRRLLPAVCLTCIASLILLGCEGVLPPPTDDSTDDPNDSSAPLPAAKSVHERIFTELLEKPYSGTSSCLQCHADKGLDLVASAHGQWEGLVANIEGVEGETHGKMDLINNFCIAVPSNEGRCTQCHPTYGFKDDSFNRDDPSNADCLVCHDTTGTYKKHPSANGGGGPPAMMIDGQLTVVESDALQEVAYSVGTPTRKACGECHFFAGGGDNVKLGTLSTDLISPTYEMDVHMGSIETGGQDFLCQSCHAARHHGIAGMTLHSVDEGGASPACTRCHGETNVHTADPFLSQVLNFHTRLACETCHIPTFSRTKPTTVEWYWDEAGQDISPPPVDEFGMVTYSKLKGRHVFAMNVKPVYMWFDGKMARKIINVSDTYTEAGTPEDPVVIAAPVATKDDPDAKIYPFKRFIGRQVADPVNQRLMVPHLFGTAGGPNPYWAKFDWNLAVQDGAAYTGQPYSGTYDFVNTVAYLPVSHEVAPRAMALTCNDCHGHDEFFQALGYKGDPFGGI